MLNYAFLLFGSIFGKVHRELFSLDIKVIISETNNEILRNFFFLTMFERGKPEENLYLFKQLFFTKLVIVDKY